VGITRIATYVPRRRLDRTVLGQTWGTRVAPGRRSVAGLDEDPLTMAVDAVLACLDDADPAGFDALYFVSTSSPYLEKQVASVVATATDLPRTTAVADFGGSVRAGDGAAAVAVGRDRVIAELVSAASVAEEFTYFWRTDEQRTVQVTEPRFGSSYGYARDVAEAVTAALRKAEVPPASVAGLALGAP